MQAPNALAVVPFVSQRKNIMRILRYCSKVFRLMGVICLLVVFVVKVHAGPLQAKTASSPAGVIIEEVRAGYAAEKAGWRVGDLLTWYADRPISSAYELDAAAVNVT